MSEVVLKHECPQKNRIAEAEAEDRIGYGRAYEGQPVFDEEFGCWVVGNGEYYSPVWHCPYCGVELRPFKGERCEHDIGVYDGVKVCRKCLTTPRTTP